MKISFEKIIIKTEKDFPEILKPIEIASKTKFLEEFVELNKDISNIIIYSLEENNSFNSTLKEVFCDCQCANEKYNCSYILPYSIHNAILKYFILVKQDGYINREYYDFITNCIFVFPCLPEKDIFMQIHKNLFCDRVLKENIMDFAYEEFILENLRINCGIDYVSNLEDIIADLKKQKQYNQNFTEYFNKVKDANFIENYRNKKIEIDVSLIKNYLFIY